MAGNAATAATAAAARDAKDRLRKIMAVPDLDTDSIPIIPLVGVDSESIQPIIQQFTLNRIFQFVPSSVELIGRTIGNRRASLSSRLRCAFRVLDLAGIDVKAQAANPSGTALDGVLKALALRQASASATDAEIVQSNNEPDLHNKQAEVAQVIENKENTI